MKKCWIAAGLAAAMMVTSLTGCGSSDGKKAVESAAVNVPTEPLGDTVKYDPSQPINDGKDISVEFWEWGSDNLFQELIDGYTAIHPMFPSNWSTIHGTTTGLNFLFRLAVQTDLQFLMYITASMKT